MTTSPRRLFRLLALAEVITWTLLILGMIAKYALHLGELGVRIGGGIHGFVFLTYAAVALLVGLDQRWRPGTIALGLGSAILPYATVPFERWAERRGLLGEVWRLGPREAGVQGADVQWSDAQGSDVQGSGAPGTRTSASNTGPLDHVVRLILRHPVLAAVVVLIAVAALFGVLLAAGPPTQWFS